jgi:two-component system, chemotaxis family, chemotaxis protein CheY
MKLRALIVEDCDSMRNLLKQALPLTGLAEFQFTEASDGLEALSKFNRSRIDILFVDWTMPNMSGLGLVRRIRESPKNNHIPIVMVTGLSSIGDVEEALDKAGADLYITKPFTIDRLRQQLEKLIEQMAARGGPLKQRPGVLGRLLGGRTE